MNNETYELMVDMSSSLAQIAKNTAPQADPLEGQLLLIEGINGEVADTLETILEMNDMSKKFKALRRLADECRLRADQATSQLNSLYDSTTQGRSQAQAGQRQEVQEADQGRDESSAGSMDRKKEVWEETLRTVERSRTQTQAQGETPPQALTVQANYRRDGTIKVVHPDGTYENLTYQEFNERYLPS